MPMVADAWNKVIDGVCDFVCLCALFVCQFAYLCLHSERKRSFG